MEIIARATAVFFFIWVLERAMGKRELSELTALELILLVTIGDLVQQGITQEDMSVTGAMLAVGTIAFWILIMSYLGFRSKRLRPVVEGFPVVVVRDGQPLLDHMHAERVPLDDLKESARNQGIGDLADVKLAILEPDGRFSFIRSDDGNGPPDATKHKT